MRIKKMNGKRILKLVGAVVDKAVYYRATKPLVGKDALYDLGINAVDSVFGFIVIKSGALLYHVKKDLEIIHHGGGVLVEPKHKRNDRVDAIALYSLIVKVRNIRGLSGADVTLYKEHTAIVFRKRTGKKLAGLALYIGVMLCIIEEVSVRAKHSTLLPRERHIRIDVGGYQTGKVVAHGIKKSVKAAHRVRYGIPFRGIRAHAFGIKLAYFIFKRLYPFAVKLGFGIIVAKLGG